MSKFVEALDSYKKVLGDLGVSFDAALLEKVTKGVGPAIYRPDAASVAVSDKEEVLRVKNNFLIKKLGLTDGPNLDKAIAEVADQMKAIKNKPRAVFYFLLVEKLGQQAYYTK